MAQKLIDHIWTLKELLTIRVPVQYVGDMTKIHNIFKPYLGIFRSPLQSVLHR